MNGMTRGSDMSRETASCKVVADIGGVVTRWVCAGLNIGLDWLGPHQTIGFVQNDRLIGGLIYHDCRPGRDVWWTLYTTDKRWCTRKNLRFMFSVAFDYYHCRRISIMTAADNVRCLKLAFRLGFETEGRLRGYGDDGKDVVIMGLLKENTKF